MFCSFCILSFLAPDGRAERAQRAFERFVTAQDVTGVETLRGASMKSPDLRGGAAVIIAGLMAKGTTEIEDTLYIERGYENVVEKFTGIGADIHYITLPEQALPEQA